jgi:pilus assembly protein CpaF
MTPSTPEWLASLLKNPNWTDLCLNGPNHLTADFGKGLLPWTPGETAPLWPPAAYQAWVLELLASTGRTWDARHPFVDATWSDRFRVHFAFPPAVAPFPHLSIRRLPRPEARGLAVWASDPFFPTLSQAVAQGQCVLISGPTGSGKTTLAQELLEKVPATERILALEDTPELAPRHPHFVPLQARPPNADGFGEITLRSLLRQSLRMRPDRIILGECRGGEVLDLLQALNTGHTGALATLHARSPREALRRIELLCLLFGGASLPLPALRELLALGLDWIVQVERTPSGRRQIKEVARMAGREGDTLLLRPVVSQKDELQHRGLARPSG